MTTVTPTDDCGPKLLGHSAVSQHKHPERPIASGAESWSTYLRRATTALRAIVNRHYEQAILVIGHGETITVAAHLFLELNVDARAQATFSVHYASITRWEQQPLAWTCPDAGWCWTSC